MIEEPIAWIQDTYLRLKADCGEHLYSDTHKTGKEELNLVPINLSFQKPFVDCITK